MEEHWRPKRMYAWRAGYVVLLAALWSCWPARCAIAQTTSTLWGAITDQQGLAIPGTVVTLEGPPARSLQAISDATGSYRFLGLQAGTYTLHAAKAGFAARAYEGLVITVNRSLTLDVTLAISPIQETVTVSAAPQLLEAGISSTGTTVLPEQIERMPINGRNYLDLMQLVTGVAINPQVDAGKDGAVPILGERGGNALFLIDGMPNNNSVDGGPASPFDQDSILEFQVLTSGYKAEFGHGSGGVINVVSKSGTSQWHGLASAFHRNNAFDSPDVPGQGAPFLQRWDPSLHAGGPIGKDRVFAFGSLERIQENRQLNFSFPLGIPVFLRTREETFNQRSETFQTRGFLKLEEQLRTHHISQQMNLAESHIANFLPLSQSVSLPSTRTSSDAHNLILGFRDTALLGDQGNPWLFNSYFEYRREPFAQRPSHPDASPATTLFNMFSSLTTGRLTGDQGQVQFGAGFTPLVIQPEYLSTGSHFAKRVASHDMKFGWDFQYTHVDGTEAGNLSNQLFATQPDFAQFGPVNSGVYVLTRVSGPTPQDNLTRLRNKYDGLFVQDDWKIAKTLTLNLGLRWDYDSRFPSSANFSPRLGLAWSPSPKTLVSASWGTFYDSFRIGLARDVPGFGGANLLRNQTISYPRLFYGDPTTLSQFNGLCPSPVLTDAQIQSSGAACPVPSLPFFGVDHLNGVVATGHVPVPPNTVVSQDNIQALTGLTPQQFADAASAAVGKQPGYFFWGGFGNLTMNFIVPRVFLIPITVDPGFKTPFTRAFHFGVQREITRNIVAQADYYHRDILNILGVRTTNLAFAARLPGHTGQLQPNTGTRPILGYGPWYQGRYDAISVSIRKNMSKRFTAEISYFWTNAIDNALNSSLTSEVQTGLGAAFLGAKGPTDSFVGVPPVVTDPISGKTNANGPFLASNGNPVPQAGKFYNGANLDRGPSDLALTHTLLLHGAVLLPQRFEISGIVRAQSGFHFSGSPKVPADVDGDGLINGVDFLTGRNHFQSPIYANLDMRFSRNFKVRERVHVLALFECFNVLNRANAAAVEQFEAVTTPLGRPLQFLPGREGQVGLRIEF
ncbi:MAG TPA: TonB-dependent receptor [Candidatus Saccharimonadales bacterium]|nr:TonB-dependent receptor [Candidatus Saccharimonadales bacterium]